MIKAGYAGDPWCKKLMEAKITPEGVTIKNRLLWVGKQMIIPRINEVQELLYHLAHNVLGHFGFEKSYRSLHESFCWPNMQWDLEMGYIPVCPECQQNKSLTHKPAGPLHPLPVPDQCGDSVVMYFIGLLPEDEGYNCILSMTDHLNSDIRIVATRTDIMVEELAVIFFDEWYCENGLPDDIVCNRDKLFILCFWQVLHKVTRVKLKMLTAYHPETDGLSKHSNKTINQCLCYHVKWNQLGWK